MNEVIRISLAAARVNAELTQRDAASQLGVSLSTLQNYENGKTCPTWETIQRMEEVYGIPRDFLNFRRG